MKKIKILILVIIGLLILSCEKETITPNPIEEPTDTIDTVVVEKHCWVCDVVYQDWYWDLNTYYSPNPTKIYVWLTWLERQDNWNEPKYYVYDCTEDESLASHWRISFTGTYEQMDSLYDTKPNYEDYNGCGISGFKITNIYQNEKYDGCYMVY